MQDSLLKSDIFFVVTTVAVVLVTILVCILAIYLIMIARKVKDISGKAEQQADLISEDISELRGSLKQQGFKLGFFSRFFKNLIKKK